jgi:hypothetical protein
VTLSVSVELGATIPTQEYGNVRPLVRIDGIDPNQDVEAQVNLALEAASKGFIAIDDKIIELVDQAAGTVESAPKIRNRVAEIEKQIKHLKSALKI